MPKVPKDEAERNKKILAEMLKQSHNKECADCTSKGPTWSPWNWGVFVCIKCAGIHRKMGTHISKVKSCTLDDWFDNEGQLIKQVGNKVGEYMYAANLSRPKPDENDDNAREDFIRNKYERRMWMRKGGEQGAYGIASGAVVIGSGEVPASPISPNSADGSKKTASNPTTPALKTAPTPTKSVPTPTKATPTPTKATASPNPAAPDLMSFGIETSSPATTTPQQTQSSLAFPVSFETQTSPASSGGSDAKSSILSMFDQPKQQAVASYPPQQRPVGIPVGVQQRPPAVYTGAYPQQGYPQYPQQQGYPQQQMYYPPQQGYPQQGYPQQGYPTTPGGGRGIPVQSPVYRAPVSPAGGIPQQVYAQPPQQQMMYRTPTTTPQMTYPYQK